MSTTDDNPITHALIFANGSVEDGASVQRILTEATPRYIVAADGGARMAYQHFGLMPHIILGDLDSLSADEVAFFESHAVEVQRHPTEKDETDLELAFKWVAMRGVQHIRVIGALGRRIDQTFANIYLMALPELAALDVRFVSGNQQIWLARAGTHHISGAVDDTLSLIPLQGDVCHIRTQGLYYPLQDEPLTFGPARGVSNRFCADDAHITFESGVLLIVHTLGRAE